MRQLYELCGENRDVRFSPYCWRTRLMLQHKGLEFDPVAITFLEKQPLESAGSRTVPVLNDNGTWVKDSFDIALYLDDTYTDKPLFGNATARAQAVVLNDWLNRTLVLGIFPMIVADLHGHLDAKNAAYFRETREKFLGCTLEDAQGTRAEKLAPFRASLAPLRAALKQDDWLAGDAPGWLDYATFGPFVWAHLTSDIDLLDKDDSLHAWRERMFDLFDGSTRAMPRAV
ncbi:glutathione S-transferase N-terminal domain-containing protein [Kordiimonas gwangyangensis]|uniref:glutathione S-transferase N-terminal domain-containing protein n=1 Tax=Kordiimonas gwangyangensis TaxID=288022 RepID=UPI00038062CC|nr:glutathione S-transferase N-terminal domain-containing protein [Kordiimonas gwangyangensis]